MFFFFFFNDTATTEIYTLSLHDALPISASLHPAPAARAPGSRRRTPARVTKPLLARGAARECPARTPAPTGRCEREVAPFPSIGPPSSGASHPQAAARATPDTRATRPRCVPA